MARIVLGIAAWTALLGTARALGFDPVQRSALMDLYNAAGGAGWKNSANWTSDQSPCTWAHVACDTAMANVQVL